MGVTRPGPPAKFEWTAEMPCPRAEFDTEVGADRGEPTGAVRDLASRINYSNNMIPGTATAAEVTLAVGDLACQAAGATDS